MRVRGTYTGSRDHQNEPSKKRLDCLHKLKDNNQKNKIPVKEILKNFLSKKTVSHIPHYQ